MTKGLVIPAKAGIPFPRVRGKVGWGTLDFPPDLDARVRGHDEDDRFNDSLGA